MNSQHESKFHKYLLNTLCSKYDARCSHITFHNLTEATIMREGYDKDCYSKLRSDLPEIIVS